MPMKLVQEGNSLIFRNVDDGEFTSAQALANEFRQCRKDKAVKATKAILETENAELKEQVRDLTFEISRLQAELSAAQSALANVKVSKPSAVTNVPKEERLKDLPMFTPHQPMTCPTHGEVRANREGYCFHCYCAAMGKPKEAVAA